MKFLTHRKGFTIIELIIVVAIIAILTAIMTSNFGESKKKSRDAKRVSDIVQLQLALEMFFDRCNQYPTVTDVGAGMWPVGRVPSLIANNGCPTGIMLSSFIGKIPAPPTTANYIYVVNNTYTDYVLRAKLETKTQALDDDVDGLLTALGNTDCSDASPNFYFCVQPR